MIGPRHNVGRRGRPTGARPGLTLVELVVSMAISGLVLVAIASTMLLAGKALPGRDAAGVTLEAARVADQIAEELHHAICIPEYSATAVTFTVADRNGDGTPEIIRYAWSGNPGDPLTRRYNGGTALGVLDDVQVFNLTYDRKTVTEVYPGPAVEGPEVCLSSYYPASGFGFRISKTAWMGQYFQPSLSGNALSWRVTRVLFAAKICRPPADQLLVQLRPIDAGRKPTGVILAERIVQEANLTAYYEWVEVWFDDVAGLSPGQGLAMVLAHPGVGGACARVLYDTSGWGRLKSASAGGSWAYNSGKCMHYYIYGKVSTPGADQAAARQHVTGVRMAVRAGDDGAARVDTAVETVNAPEVLSAIWQCDFDADPTAIDFGGDGSTDWTSGAAGGFDPRTLDGGVWKANRILGTEPANRFGELTTVDVRLRSTAISGVGAGVAVNADWVSGNCAGIFARVQLQVDDTQKLIVYNTIGMAGHRALVTVAGLSGGFVDLRLLIDPNADTVNVAVNGTDRGTYTYEKVAGASVVAAGRCVSLLPGGSAAEFDFVRVRVGGGQP